MYVVSRCCCFDSSNDPTNSLPCLDAPVTWRVFKLEELEELGECGAFLLLLKNSFFFAGCGSFCSYMYQVSIISSSSVGKFVVHTVGTTNTVYTYM